VVESASEIGLTRRLGEEEYCKNRAQNGAVLAVPVRMTDLRGCSDRKIVSRCRDQARRAYNGVVFEAKKEIPVNNQGDQHEANHIHLHGAACGHVRRIRATSGCPT
jgi:hypothetical protein